MTQTTLKTTKAAAPKKRAKPTSDDENIFDAPDSLNDDSLLSNTPPSAKKQKKAPAPRKGAGKPLQPIDNESTAPGALDGTDDFTADQKDQYQKVSVLARSYAQ